ncbi:hypothetical protein H477_1868 [[Clostridium] sordellii ATCC 9714]|nr:hypothetical protein H477_1868 [[Clostridium] sordellii ATCC 9714] [Paeniclostridium sordellii ATCC 9714]
MIFSIVSTMKALKEEVKVEKTKNIMNLNIIKQNCKLKSKYIN